MTREELKNITAEEIFNNGEYEGNEYGLELFLEVEGEDFMPIVYISREDIKNYFNAHDADNEEVNELYWQNEDEVDFYLINAQLDRIKAEIIEELEMYTF